MLVPLSREESLAKANAARERMKSRGLGDTVKKVLDATGVSAVAKVVFGSDCGCKKRQERLNALVPYAEAAPHTTDAAAHP